MSATALFVTLPYPPSANRMWRHVGRKVLRSRQYEAWRKEVCAIVRDEISGAIGEPYALTLQVGRPDRRRRDLDNLIKPVSDALVLAGAVTDDANCQRIEASWSSEIEGVRVMVLTTKFVEPLRAKAKFKNSVPGREDGCAGDEGAADEAVPSELHDEEARG